MRKRSKEMKLRRSAPRLKPSERTYAHSSKLWLERGGAPSRYTMLTALFSSQKSNKNKIAFRRPNVDEQSDGDDDDGDEAPLHTAVFIDDESRFYFFPKKEVDNAGADAELDGIFLLRDGRDSTTPVLGETLSLYRISGTDIHEYAPPPSRAQILEASRLHKVRYDELRLKLGNWQGLIDSKRREATPSTSSAGSSNGNGHYSAALEFTPENFTRKRTMTTGRIGGMVV